jgi:hypothetical protein
LGWAAVLTIRRRAEQITNALGALRAWLTEADRVRIGVLALPLALLPGRAAVLLVALLLAGLGLGVLATEQRGQSEPSKGAGDGGPE